VVEDVGRTAALNLDTSMERLNRAMAALTLTPRCWENPGNWLWIWEFNVRLKDWVPVNVQTTKMSIKKRLGILLSASFRPNQPQYNTEFSALLRQTSPDQWRIRIIPESFWIDDNGKHLDINDALKFFILKYKTYPSDENPHGCSVQNSPTRSPSQRTASRSVRANQRFTYLDTPSKQKRHAANAQQQPEQKPLASSNVKSEGSSSSQQPFCATAVKSESKSLFDTPIKGKTAAVSTQSRSPAKSSSDASAHSSVDAFGKSNTATTSPAQSSSLFSSGSTSRQSTQYSSANPFGWNDTTVASAQSSASSSSNNSAHPTSSSSQNSSAFAYASPTFSFRPRSNDPYDYI